MLYTLNIYNVFGQPYLSKARRHDQLENTKLLKLTDNMGGPERKYCYSCKQVKSHCRRVRSPSSWAQHLSVLACHCFCLWVSPAFRLLQAWVHREKLEAGWLSRGGAGAGHHPQGDGAHGSSESEQKTGTLSCSFLSGERGTASQFLSASLCQAPCWTATLGVRNQICTGWFKLSLGDCGVQERMRSSGDRQHSPPADGPWREYKPRTFTFFQKNLES